MNETRIAVYRRSALALSSIAVTTAVWFGAVPPALADPYDDGDSSETTDNSGSANQPDAPTAPDLGEPAGPDAAEPAQGGEEPAPEAPAEPPPADEAPGSDGAGESGSAAGPGDEDNASDADSSVTDPAVDADALQPDVAEVPQQDFDEAHGTDALDVDSTTASDTEVNELTESLESVVSSTTTTTSSTWSSGVLQWNSAWIGYDNWYRPVFTNPYSTPLQLIYPYDDGTLIFEVPPMQRAVLTAPDAGAYNFTAVNRDPSGKPVTVSIGSFSGGGYQPTPGQPPPAKPVPPTTFKNVLVQLKYDDKLSKPFRVKTLADLGDDPSVGGHRALLDDETPVWGTWTKTAGGERLFEVTSTNQLPGITKPSQGPVPGYRVQLTSNEASSTPAEKTWVKPLVIAAAVGAVLAVGVVAFVLAGRRRKRTP
ncbi:hypothetical protein BST36_00235 [Mycolicibacterium moriokaense]|uniref:Uncharacterized protein n=1 Tax=Mycolicibacterium moriokaense TaxID=39691 RepID=A0AAD1M611_9MYCO|nr:hypothetical protein [Mycolicibacterium moriokaense]MCV7041249.1 hypothetical protein [Mycolicibacterium moriokaense]ORB27154.1 hypothetical protein BST36_00235 [Mycolicibacterium moriokaense]BBX00814.1 hypothetical protein MMOR_17500 [Mycolicibacterium moriokaense]